MRASYPMVHDLFLGWLERTPDHVFLRHLTSAGEERRTYRQVGATIIGTIDALRASGVRPGDRAVIHADSVPALHFMLSCAFLGVPFAPLAPGFSPEAARRLGQRLDASVFLTTSNLVARLRDVGIRALCYGDEEAGEGPDRIAPSPRPRAHDVDALRACCAGRSSDEDYIILSTSGTTGEPKLAIRSHRAFTFSARTFGEVLEVGAEPREKVLLCSGLVHGLGQTVFSFCLHLGAELCAPEALEAAVSLQQVRQLDPSLILVHPRVIESLYRQHLAAGGGPRARFLGHSLRLLRTGGSHVDLELLRILAAQGIDVGEWYASTETGMVSLTPRGQWRPGEVGQVCRGVDVLIAEDHEILVRSPGQMLRYHGQEHLPGEAAFSDGFIRTGDLGQLGPGRVLRLVGRKKEVLNAPDGTNIAAAPIESLIAALPWVDQVVLIGDRRPFLAALIVVLDAPRSDEADGFLSEQMCPELHARARADISAINDRLEAIEGIQSFALLGKRFDASLYADVAMGKIRRDRGGIDAAYTARIDALYAGGFMQGANGMTFDSTRWHADAWNASSDIFDGPALSFLERIGVKAVELLSLAPGAHVLDFACGSGHSVIPAAERVGRTGHVLGVDLAGNLVDLAREKARTRGLRNVDFRVGDMQTIDCGIEQFDIVLCLFGLSFARDMSAQVGRFWSHLRPGGTLGIAVWAPEGLEPARHEIWVSTMKAELPELYQPSRVTGVEHFRAILASGGITEVDIIACDEVQPLRSPEDWWEILRGLGPSRWSMDRLTPEQLARVRQLNLDWVRDQGLTEVNVNWLFARATTPERSGAPRP